jgi:DNA-binding FrmR family transcriptional regulator
MAAQAGGPQTGSVKEQLQTRLRRIEGQVRGVHKMVEEERSCADVVQQLNAIQAAVQQVADLYVRAHVKDCLLNTDATEVREREAVLDSLLDLMMKARA